MIKRHTISFYHAAEGIVYALRTQPNFVVHLIVAGGVIGLGWGLKVSAGEWAILAMAMAMGLVIELLNTAIEATVDLVTSDIKPLAKVAKDCASGAMLVYAVGASVVGLIIFVPKIPWLSF